MADIIREISAEKITAAVRELCISANRLLPDDIKKRLDDASKNETNSLAKSVLGDLILNYNIAEQKNIPICQDTGMAVVLIELGQDVHITGGFLTDAVNEGVRQGYVEGLLRCSVVKDPFYERVNTNDNTPAVIHLNIVEGDKIKITVAPKGFGSENMSKLRMFTPAAGEDDIVNFVCECVKTAGSNPCPPIVVGVGIGGTFERCAYLAKLALCRSTDEKNSDERYAELEQKMLDKINELDVGPQGFGGKTTALAVNIEKAPTHIAGLPVAVNIGCHVTRHKSCIL